MPASVSLPVILCCFFFVFLCFFCFWGAREVCVLRMHDRGLCYSQKVLINSNIVHNGGWHSMLMPDDKPWFQNANELQNVCKPDKLHCPEKTQPWVKWRTPLVKQQPPQNQVIDLLLPKIDHSSKWCINWVLTRVIDTVRETIAHISSASPLSEQNGYDEWLVLKTSAIVSFTASITLINPHLIHPVCLLPRQRRYLQSSLELALHYSSKSFQEGWSSRKHNTWSDPPNSNPAHYKGEFPATFKKRIIIITIQEPTMHDQMTKGLVLWTLSMYGWEPMHWMHEWMNEWMDGWIDGWMNAIKEGGR